MFCTWGAGVQCDLARSPPSLVPSVSAHPHPHPQLSQLGISWFCGQMPEVETSMVCKSEEIYGSFLAKGMRLS